MMTASLNMTIKLIAEEFIQEIKVTYCFKEFQGIQLQPLGSGPSS